LQLQEKWRLVGEMQAAIFARLARTKTQTITERNKDLSKETTYFEPNSLVLRQWGNGRRPHKLSPALAPPERVVGQEGSTVTIEDLASKRKRQVHVEHITLYHEGEEARAARLAREQLAREEEGTWEVEQIVGHELSKEGTRSFREIDLMIKWKDFEEPSLHPLADFVHLKAFKDYLLAHEDFDYAMRKTHLARLRKAFPDPTPLEPP